MSLSMRLLEKGLLPDLLIRWGMRRLLQKKLAEESRGGPKAQKERFNLFLKKVKESPISIHSQAANEQHYELPAEFFIPIMGKHMKYSSGLWPEGVETMDDSEEKMLRLTVERAGLEDGQKILELGCGWGSLSLYMAEHFPKSHITAVSNSHSQKKFIDEKARERGLKNLSVITAEMSQLELSDGFDRIVTVEMFEHMRNYEKLFEKVAGFVRPGGEMFIHVFSHRQFAYFYEETNPEDWIARYFFTGGTMPSHDLFLEFQKNWILKERWRVSGTHYQKTCRFWLRRMDDSKKIIEPILQRVYGKEAGRWWIYWRVFFMACEELFAYKEGEEWGVSHYRFKKR